VLDEEKEAKERELAKLTQAEEQPLDESRSSWELTPEEKECVLDGQIPKILEATRKFEEELQNRQKQDQQDGTDSGLSTETTYKHWNLPNGQTAKLPEADKELLVKQSRLEQLEQRELETHSSDKPSYPPSRHGMRLIKAFLRILLAIVGGTMLGNMVGLVASFGINDSYGGSVIGLSDGVWNATLPNIMNSIINGLLIGFSLD